MKNLRILFAIAFCAIISLSVCVAFEQPSSDAFILTPVLFLGGLAIRKGMKHQRGIAMVTVCGEQNAGSTISCDNPIIPGVDADVILLDVKHITGKTLNVTNPYILEALVLASGKQGFKFQGKNNSAKPKRSLVVKDFGKFYEHSLDLIVFEDGSDTKVMLDGLKDASVCAFVKNKYSGADAHNTWEVYGFYAGLDLKVLEMDKYDETTGGAYKLSLKSDPKSLEGKLPLTFYKTSDSVTQGLVDELLTPAP